MRLASFVISFCLHAGFVLLVLFWPSPPLQKVGAQPITVSLVDGLPGGNRAPVPILGRQGALAPTPEPPPPSAPPKEAPPPVPPAPLPEAVPLTIEKTLPPKPEVPEPVRKPPPVPDTVPAADKKPAETAKHETPKADDKKPEAKKPEPQAKKPEPPRDPVREALEKARAATKTTPGEVKVKPNVVASALAAARKKSGGQGGGGGGEGEGEGGGGIGDVYAAQIVMAVQPNWHWPAQAQGRLSVALYLKINAGGRVLDVRVEESSGNAIFDSSAVSAVRVTQVLPPPPGPLYHELILRFFPMQ